MNGSVRDVSPAMVVAVIALFASLAGVSHGVATGSIDSREIRDGAVRSRDVANGSVQSRDVRDGALRGRDLANGSIRSRDVRDGALRSADVHDGALGGADVAPNSLGDQQIAEPQLDINRLGGLSASRYVRNVRRVRTATASDPSSPKLAPPARCRRGKRLLGGGARVVAPQHEPVSLTTNGPNGNAWIAAAYATAPTGNWQLVSVAICG